MKQLSEEVFNTVTHGIGLILSIIASYHLINVSWSSGSSRHLIAHVIYSLSLVILYLTSTIYHGIQDRKIKPIFNLLDHLAIFVFISGTYTPFALTLLWGHNGFIVLGIAWSIGLLGILYKVLFWQKWPLVSILLYLLAGWLALAILSPMLEYFPKEAVNLLFGGGVFYTIGVLFFLLDERLKYFHAVWHVFVMLGSLFHYMAVLRYTMP
jgi:hemolysin III